MNPPTCPPSPAPSDAGGAEGAARPEGLTWWLQQGAQVFLWQGGDLERTKKKNQCADGDGEATQCRGTSRLLPSTRMSQGCSQDSRRRGTEHQQEAGEVSAPPASPSSVCWAGAGRSSGTAGP